MNTSQNDVHGIVTLTVRLQEEKQKTNCAEGETPQKAAEAKAVKLYAQYPPIEKMDASLSTLSNCT